MCNYRLLHHWKNLVSPTKVLESISKIIGFEKIEIVLLLIILVEYPPARIHRGLLPLVCELRSSENPTLSMNLEIGRILTKSYLNDIY